jgi:hypothetical protein
MSSCCATIVTSVDAMLLNELPANIGAEAAAEAALPSGVRRGAPRLRIKMPSVVGGRMGRLTPGRVCEGPIASGSTMALTRRLKPGEAGSISL